MERAFKYHGLGNDFVILDRRATGEDIDDERARRLCDRHRGVGADGVLVLLPAKPFETAAFRMVVHNSDGSVPEMCGNGLRCAVKYAVDHRPSGKAPPEALVVDTGAGPLRCEVGYDGEQVSWVRASMGPARLLAPHLPTTPGGSPFVDRPLEGHPTVRGTAVSMGNPHLVLFSTPLDEAEVLGPVLEVHPFFPEKTNVGFARLEPGGMSLRVWERGAGLTQACGTAACAAVAAAVHEGRLEAEVWHTVRLPGGPLRIRARSDLSEVLMEGPAERVFVLDLP